MNSGLRDSQKIWGEDSSKQLGDLSPHGQHRRSTTSHGLLEKNFAADTFLVWVLALDLAYQISALFV
ncbi:hypothetical protein ACFX13_020635 [Malus domestica]